jgi:hypothetical protein
VVGTQLVGFGLSARAFAVHQLGDPDPWVERKIGRIRLEHGLLVGGSVTLVGITVGAVVVGGWIASGLGSLSEERLLILAATLVTVGLQVVFTSFLISILAMRPRHRRSRA